jgi:hypothetical protein
MGHVIEETTDVERVKALWIAMVEHHGEVTGLPVRDGEESWRRRRVEYAEWLAGGRTFVLLAVPEAGGEPDGYALVRVRDGGSTFDLGEPVGELESLAVSPRARLYEREGFGPHFSALLGRVG